MASSSIQWKVLSPIFLLGVMALAVTALRFWLEAHVGFSLWDPGFLWYGVQRVLAGGVPIRDFMAYDPGRYYWAAGWMWFLHQHGFVAVRTATYAFAAIGLVCAGIIVRSASEWHRTARWMLVVFAMLVCATWMAPWWKAYDATAPIILACSLGYLLAHPSSKAFFGYGLVLGCVAVLGRNHGLYGVIAYLVATPLLGLCSAHQASWLRNSLACAGGVVLGYLPVWACIVFDHAFAVEFWQRIESMLFVHKSTNLPLPVPWPSLSALHLPAMAMLREWAIGLWFIALPLFCLVGTLSCVRSLRRERRVVHPWFMACVATAIPYLNVAFSRADVSHLAQASMPCLIGLLIWPHGLLPRPRHYPVRCLIAASVIVLTVLIVVPLHPVYRMHQSGRWKHIHIGADHMWVTPAVAREVAEIRSVSNQFLCKGETLLAVPVWPGAYALLGVQSPVWEIYPLLWRTDSFQLKEIARLQRHDTPIVLLNDVAVDGRQQLRYANTHPIIWHYISTHYHLADDAPVRGHLKVYLANTRRGERSCATSLPR